MPPIHTVVNSVRYVNSDGDLIDASVAVFITERALNRKNIKPISNLIGRRILLTAALAFIYSDQLQRTE